MSVNKGRNKKLNIYYFAYGSNMLLGRMKQRCGEKNFCIVGPAIIENYILVFTRRSVKWCNMGVADLKYQKGKKTYGVLFKINDLALEQLDKNEGYKERRAKEKNSYNRLDDVKVRLVSSQVEYKTRCYFANPEAEFIQPSRAYLDILMKGAEENELPREAKEMIIEIGRYSNV